MKFMRARFAGRDAWTGDKIRKGDAIYWSRAEGAVLAYNYERGNKSETPSYAGVDERLRERRLGDREYAAGVADAERYRFNRDYMGEEYAAAEELAWSLRTGEGW